MRKNHLKPAFVLFTVVLAAFAAAPSARAQTKTLTEWTLPHAASRPFALVAPPYVGTVAFTELVGRIGILDPSANTITEWSLDPNSAPLGISSLYNELIVFSENKANAVAALVPLLPPGRGTNPALLFEVTLPSPSSSPVVTAISPCGIFFAEASGNRIGLIQLGFRQDGTIPVGEWAVPTAAAGPQGLAVVYNGSTGICHVWFTETDSNKVGRLDVSSVSGHPLGAPTVGTFTEWAVPGGGAGLGLALLRVSNGQVFFGNPNNNTLDRLDPATNIITEWTNPEGAPIDGIRPLGSGLVAFTDFFKVGILDTTSPGVDTVVTPTTTMVTSTLMAGSGKRSVLFGTTYSVPPVNNIVTGVVTDGFTLWGIPTSPFAFTNWIDQLPSGALVFNEQTANKIATLK